MKSSVQLLVFILIFGSSVSELLGETVMMNSTYSCFALSNLTCIPRQTILTAVAGQSQNLLILPKAVDAGTCISSCASSLPVSAAIGNVNASIRFDSSLGVFILQWQDPNTYKIAGNTFLRAYIGGNEISNSPLSVSITAGPESLSNLLIFGAGSLGGQVNTSISL